MSASGGCACSKGCWCAGFAPPGGLCCFSAKGKKVILWYPIVDNSKAWNPIIFAQRDSHTYRVYTLSYTSISLYTFMYTFTYLHIHEYVRYIMSHLYFYVACIDIICTLFKWYATYSPPVGKLPWW